MREYIDRFDDRYIKLYINDTPINRLIHGFTLLNCFGRTTLDKNTQIVTSASYDGGMLTQITYKPRVLTIEYMIKADSDSSLMRKFETLNKVLQGRLKITLSDDKYSYYGELKNIEVMNDTTNWIVSRFEIVCTDIYKYSDTNTIEVGSATKFNYGFMYGVIPDKITVTINRDSSGGVAIKNTTTGSRIRLIKSVNRNDKVIFDITNKKVYINEIDGLKYLDIRSDFEDFIINKNDILSCEHKAVIEFRERLI